MRRYILIVIGIIILSGVVAPLAFAAESSITFVPQISIPGTNIQAGQTINIDGTTIGRYIIALYTFGVYAAGIVATVMLMAAGFVWLMAGGNSSQVEQAKTMIRGALTGYVLLLVSWVLLNTINPNLTEFRNLDMETANNIPLPNCELHEAPPSDPVYTFELDPSGRSCVKQSGEQLKCYCRTENQNVKVCWYKYKFISANVRCLDISDIYEGNNPPSSHNQKQYANANSSCEDAIREQALEQDRIVCPQ